MLTAASRSLRLPGHAFLISERCLREIHVHYMLNTKSDALRRRKRGQSSTSRAKSRLVERQRSRLEVVLPSTLRAFKVEKLERLSVLYKSCRTSFTKA